MNARRGILLVDSLERRALLAARLVPSAAGDVLVVSGTPSGDLIVLNSEDDQIVVVVNGLQSRVSADQLVGVLVDSGGGADRVEQNTALPSTLIGGDGNDTIRGGDGVDSLSGGEGDDLLHWSVEKNYFEGGSGIDTVDYSLSKDGINLIGDAGEEPDERPFPQAARTNFLRIGPGGTEVFGARSYIDGTSVEAIRGTDHVDIMGFTVGYSTFSVLPALVTLYGGAGDDIFNGAGFEAVVVNGEAGNDRLTAFLAVGEWATLNGGEGDDTFKVDPNFLGESTRIDPGPGSDWLDLDEDDLGIFDMVVLNASLPENVFGVGSSPTQIPTIVGDERDNVVIAGSPSGSSVPVDPVRFVGNGGNDLLIGGFGNDTLDGGRGNDVLRDRPSVFVGIVGPDLDVLLGDAGNDQIFAADGQRDTIDGGPGRDYAQFDSGRGVGDIVTNVEKLDARAGAGGGFAFAVRRAAGGGGGVGRHAATAGGRLTQKHAGTAMVREAARGRAGYRGRTPADRRFWNANPSGANCFCTASRPSLMNM